MAKSKTGSASREDQAGCARCREALQPKKGPAHPAACDPANPVFSYRPLIVEESALYNRCNITNPN